MDALENREKLGLHQHYFVGKSCQSPVEFRGSGNVHMAQKAMFLVKKISRIDQETAGNAGFLGRCNVVLGVITKRHTRSAKLRGFSARVPREHNKSISSCVSVYYNN